MLPQRIPPCLTRFWCAVRKDEPDFSAGREVVDHVFDPCEVRIACGRETVLPARVFLQLFLTPVLEVEGRVRHNEIKVPRIESDIMELFEGIAFGQLDEVNLRIDPRTAVTVVCVSGNALVSVLSEEK